MSIKDKDSNVFVSLGLVLVDIYAAIPPRNATSLWGRLLKVAIVLGLLFCLKDLIKGLLVLAAIGALAYFAPYFAPSRSSKDADEDDEDGWRNGLHPNLGDYSHPDYYQYYDE